MLSLCIEARFLEAKRNASITSGELGDFEKGWDIAK